MRLIKTSRLAGIIFTIILFSLVILILPVQAADLINPTSPTDKINAPLLEITIPGLNFTNVGTIGNATSTGIPWLGEYIIAIFQFGTAIASIVAVIMIIIYGIQIVLSGDGQAKMAAYKNIGRVFIGLILLWGSYAILYNINTNLVAFKPLNIEAVDVVKDISAGAQSAQSLQNTVKKCTGYTDDGLKAALDPVLLAAAKTAGMDDPIILAAIFQQENGSRTTPIRGPCGEVGITQLMPGTLQQSFSSDPIVGTCCVASTRNGCGTVLTPDKIGQSSNGGAPYFFEYKATVSAGVNCSHGDQASKDCVDFFHTSKDANKNSFTYSAKLIQQYIIPNKNVNGDIALTFAGYNTGAGYDPSKSQQAMNYAKTAIGYYKSICTKAGGTSNP